MRVTRAAKITVTATAMSTAIAGIIAGTGSTASADTCDNAAQLVYNPLGKDAAILGATHWSCNTSPVYDWYGWAIFSHGRGYPGYDDPVANDTAAVINNVRAVMSIYSLPDFEGAVSYVPAQSAVDLHYLRNNNRSARWR
jgi:hypothetical protein